MTSERVDYWLTELQTNLKPWLPQGGQTEQLLEPVAKACAELETEYEKVESGTRVLTADSKEELNYFAEVVGITPDESESVEFYRKRILSELAKLSSDGSPKSILEFTTLLFDVRPQAVTLENTTGSGGFTIRLPLTVIQNQVDTAKKATRLFENITASTYGVDISGTGTLEYITPSEYNNSNYDTQYGYATISNGSVTDGGTYSELI